MPLPDFMDFSYRKEEVSLTDLFPRIDMEKARRRFAPLRDKDAHQTVYTAAVSLWDEGGYDYILEKFGFHDVKNPVFSGHCHQCTPALGLVLKMLEFEQVAYLECYRIDAEKFCEGLVEKVSPVLEQNPAMKEEFCNIGRIPYCCLEAQIGEELFYISGKHIKPVHDESISLLQPHCYRDFVGVSRHQDAPERSGIYLQPVLPAKNPQGINFYEQIVWKKQTLHEKEAELFCTYVRMELQC